MLRWASAGFTLLFFTFYASSGFVAGGKLFQSVFGLPYGEAVAADALAVIASVPWVEPSGTQESTVQPNSC